MLIKLALIIAAITVSDGLSFGCGRSPCAPAALPCLTPSCIPQASSVKAVTPAVIENPGDNPELLTKIDEIHVKATKIAAAKSALFSAPIVLLNSKIAFGAGKLPALLAAKGALLGAAIATPIQKMAAFNSAVGSALMSNMVSAPIAVISGAQALRLALQYQAEAVKGVAAPVVGGSKGVVTPVAAGKGIVVPVIAAPVSSVKSNFPADLPSKDLVAGAGTVIGGGLMAIGGKKLKTVGQLVSFAGNHLSALGPKVIVSGKAKLGAGADEIKSVVSSSKSIPVKTAVKGDAKGMVYNQEPLSNEIIN